MLGLTGPEGAVKAFQFGVVQGQMNEAEAFGAPGFHQGGNQQPVQEAPLAAGVAEGQQGVDVRVLLVRSQLQPARDHHLVHLLEMHQLLLGQGDQGWNDAGAVRVFDHEAHGQGRGLALAVGVIDQKRVEMLQDVPGPGRIGLRCQLW